MTKHGMTLFVLGAFMGISGCKELGTGSNTRNQYASKACDANLNPIPLDKKDFAEIKLHDLSSGVFKYSYSEFYFKSTGISYSTHFKHIGGNDFENYCATQIGPLNQVIAKFTEPVPVGIAVDNGAVAFVGAEVTWDVQGTSATVSYNPIKDKKNTNELKVFMDIREVYSPGSEMRAFKLDENTIEIRSAYRDQYQSSVVFTRSEVKKLDEF